MPVTVSPVRKLNRLNLAWTDINIIGAPPKNELSADRRNPNPS